MWGLAEHEGLTWDVGPGAASSPATLGRLVGEDPLSPYLFQKRGTEAQMEKPPSWRRPGCLTLRPFLSQDQDLMCGEGNLCFGGRAGG